MLDNLKRPKGSRKKKKRLGRGDASGHGGTSTRGTKGQLARKGGKEPGFEGGQTPLKLRIPKRGFSNPNRIEYQIVGLSSLNRFSENQNVDKKLLFESRLIKDINKPVKILANGEINIPLTIKIDAISKSAKEKIEKIGGKIIYESIRRNCKAI